jgi:hypothetical protein
MKSWQRDKKYLNTRTGATEYAKVGYQAYTCYLGTIGEKHMRELSILNGTPRRQFAIRVNNPLMGRCWRVERVESLGELGRRPSEFSDPNNPALRVQVHARAKLNLLAPF